MIPLLKSILYALLWDANAARRWIRGTIGTVATSGAVYADQVAALGGVPHLAQAIRWASLAAAFAVAAHGDPVSK